ncbi:MAG: nitroreductase family protein, partial [Myxococcota bacterium]
EDGGISAKLALEDHATVSCATQNFMQSLAEDGIGTKWMTGALGLAPEDILEAAGVSSDEKMVGVVWYGYGDQGELSEMKTPKRKLGVDEVLTKVA